MAELHFGIMAGAFPNLERCAELSRLIDQYQFDSLHGVDGAGSWDPYVLMYIMAEHTKSIPLRLTLVNPYYLHPVKTTLFAATIQHACNGRFGITFGGGSIDTLHSLGLDWIHPAKAIRESIHVFRDLMKGEVIHFKGDIITADGNDMWFPPPAEIPIYIGCQRKYLTRLAGEITDGVLLDGATSNYADWAMKQLEIGAARVGRDIQREIEEGKFWFQTVPSMNISENPEEAFDRVRASVPYSLQTMSEERRKRSGLSADVVKKIQQLMHRQNAEAFEEAKKLITNDMIRKIDPVGTVEDVIRYIKNCEKAGYNGFCLRVASKAERGAEETLKLFTEHVRPEFR
jgi:alkanesulfonate monooxygenase SsuD/methylene tetrahydromethanopterin reductase-like flavin-dependent oxidoreductase (luciferase family)